MTDDKDARIAELVGMIDKLTEQVRGYIRVQAGVDAIVKSQEIALYAAYARGKADVEKTVKANKAELVEIVHTLKQVLCVKG